MPTQERKTKALWNKRIILTIIIMVVLIFFYILFQAVYIYPLPNAHTTTIGKWKTISYQSFESIPKRIGDAITTIEDKRFWQHDGIDFLAIGRAAYQTFFKNNTQWWSTIDQQLIKLTDKAFTRSRRRKIYEAIIANNLQFHHTKQEIFLAYVNSIPFSHGITWRASACDIYFHKTCEYLSDAELSYLFSVAQLGINPYKEMNQKKIYTRARTLCSVLSEKEVFTDKDGCAVLHSQQENGAEIIGNTWWTVDSSQTGTSPSNTIEIPKITKQTKQQRPIQLYTYQAPVDPKIQLFLDSLPIEQQTSFSLEQYNRIENILATTQEHREVYDAQYCCVVAVDKNGWLISMNTCSDWDDTESAWRVNSCTDPRQVWSALKPFLYTYAFHEKWLHATDTIIDEPISFDLGDGSTYSPKNFDLSYRGEVTYAFALGNSLNVPAIKTLHDVWVSEFLAFLKEQLAIYASWYDTNKKDAENVGLSLALGTYEITPYAFTQLWRFFLPNKTPPIYTTNAQEITDILSNPINRGAAFGQDSFLNLPWRAVKTGTSRKFIDAWVCGVNTTKWVTLCLWMGNINNLSMKWPSSEIGSYIWNVIAKGM